MLFPFVAFGQSNISDLDDDNGPMLSAIPDTETVYGDPVAGVGNLLAPPQAIGKHGAGKLVSAIRLPDAGIGFQIHRVEGGTSETQIDKMNVWGTTLLVSFVEWLSAALNKIYQERPVLSVATLSKRSGGAFSDHGHASHQNGLDVDIGYPTLKNENEKPFPNFIVDRQVSPLIDQESFWTAAKILGAQEQVVLIFVDSGVKSAMCSYAKKISDYSANSDSPNFQALMKMQPWKGHNNHFHLRLQCPSTSSQCVKAIPISVNKGTGC